MSGKFNTDTGHLPFDYNRIKWAESNSVRKGRYEPYIDDIVCVIQENAILLSPLMYERMGKPEYVTFGKESAYLVIESAKEDIFPRYKVAKRTKNELMHRTAPKPFIRDHDLADKNFYRIYRGTYDRATDLCYFDLTQRASTLPAWKRK